MSDLSLIDFLESQLTERRRELFQKVLMHRTRHLAVVIENAYQPHNASAVLRTCECLGIQDVHIIELDNRFDANSGIVMGADKWLTLHRYTDSNMCLQTLRSKGYRIVATQPRNDVYSNNYVPDKLSIKKKTAIFFGSEESGLSRQVLDNADALLNIPLFGFTESFNLSVSVGIAMYHLIHSLHKTKAIDWELSTAEKQELRIEWAVKSIKKGETLVKYYYENHAI